MSILKLNNKIITLNGNIVVQAVSKIWIINDTVDSTTYATFSQPFTVTIDGTTYNFNKLTFSDGYVFFDNNVASGGANWTPEGFRRITFSIAPSGDLLAFLQSNATEVIS